MDSLRPYLHIIRTAAREDSANTKRLVGGILVSVVRVGLIAAVYKVAYQHYGGRPGLSYENTVWSIAIYFAFILNLGLRNVFKVVERQVKTGAVEVGVIKPIDWRLARVCELIGKNGIEFLLQLIVLPAFLLLVVGPPDVSYLSAASLAAFGFLTLLAMVAAASMFLTVGLTAFWLNDAQSVFRLLDKIVVVFGGAFVPIALLPHTVQLFVRYSPFGVYAAPTQLFNPALTRAMLPMIISAVIWSIVLVGLCNLVWKRAMVRIEVNGG